MHTHIYADTCPICEPWPHWARHIAAHLNHLEELAMATQADIDALTASVNTDRTAIASVIAELNALIAQGQPVQVTALQAAVDGLTADIAADAPPASPAV